MSLKWMFLTTCSLLTIVGCGASSEYESYENAPMSENTDTGHEHHHEGAHGGQVIEFDPAHAHHAELVFNEDSRDITLYFYGAQIGEAHPAENLVFELEEGDDELHLDVAASPLEGETEETASSFVIAGSEVPENIKSAAALHGHFHVTLDGQDFRGSFGEHEGHDHDGDEEHGEHEGHDDDDGHGEDSVEEEEEEAAAGDAE
jgi:hypothetical protein